MMGQDIDCLIIGHNEMQFEEYEGLIRRMGINSETYRDLNMNFINYHNKPYTAPGIFNMMRSKVDNSYKPISLGNTFSATISYLGTYLHRRGITFDYANSFQDEKEQIKEKLLNHSVKMVAITTTLYVSIFPILEIVKFIREYDSKVKIVVGGPFISNNMRIMDQGSITNVFNTINADFYVYDVQGEAAFAKIILALKGEQEFDNINNIAFKADHGYVLTKKSPENNELEENTVDWRLFKNKADSSVSLRTAISCPFSCSFCGFPEHAGKYQTASVEFVERELDTLKSIGSVERIHIIDDTFNVPPQRFKNILRMMIKNRYHFKWHSYFRCQYADSEMVELMAESGCEGVFLGIESGNPQILKNMNKSAGIEDYERGISLLKEYNIITFASFIVGFPGETYNTYQDTLNFIENNQPDFYRAQLWYCDPMTPIWKQQEKYKIRGTKFKWEHETMNSQVASDMIEEMFQKVKNSIWLSQYNFDFVGIFSLMNRHMSLTDIKDFVTAFNLALKEKLVEPQRNSISLGVEQRLLKACKSENNSKNLHNAKKALENFDAGFSFD